MPIYVKKAAELNTDDIEDLKKIYADYPVKSAQDRLQDYLAGKEHDGWTLMHARFNDRLLGALWIQEEDGKQIIQDMCVREITRGRGVGRRMTEVCLDTYDNLAAGSIPDEITDKDAALALIEKYSS